MKVIRAGKNTVNFKTYLNYSFQVLLNFQNFFPAQEKKNHDIPLKRCIIKSEILLNCAIYKLMIK